jgi:hypothetical protein
MSILVDALRKAAVGRKGRTAVSLAEAFHLARRDDGGEERLKDLVAVRTHSRKDCENWLGWSPRMPGSTHLPIDRRCVNVAPRLTKQQLRRSIGCHPSHRPSVWCTPLPWTTTVPVPRTRSAWRWS